MTDPIQFVLEEGPTSRLVVKNALMASLYDPFDQYFNREMEQIAVRNCLINTHQHKSFRHKSVLYLYEKPQKGPHFTPRLHPELVPIAESLIAEKTEIETKEKPLAADYIVSMLMRTTYVSDYFALLPEYLHRPLIDSSWVNPMRPMMKAEQIESFKVLHKKGYEALHTRAMWNLLLTN